MILTGPEIEKAVASGDITFEPFAGAVVGSNSVDFTLGDRLLVYDLPILNCTIHERTLDPQIVNHTRELTIPESGLTLLPGTLYLGSTREIIGSTKYVPQLAARSSWGRLGLSVYLNSGFGDTGFVGRWTLEITVVHPLRVRPGDRIGQVYFTEVKGELRQYAGRYQRPEGPQASLAHVIMIQIERPRCQGGKGDCGDGRCMNCNKDF